MEKERGQSTFKGYQGGRKPYWWRLKDLVSACSSDCSTFNCTSRRKTNKITRLLGGKNAGKEKRKKNKKMIRGRLAGSRMRFLRRGNKRGKGREKKNLRNYQLGIETEQEKESQEGARSAPATAGVDTAEKEASGGKRPEKKKICFGKDASARCKLTKSGQQKNPTKPRGGPNAVSVHRAKGLEKKYPGGGKQGGSSKGADYNLGKNSEP